MQDILGQTIHPGCLIAYAVRATFAERQILKVGKVIKLNGRRLHVRIDPDDLRTVMLKSPANVVVIGQ